MRRLQAFWSTLLLVILLQSPAAWAGVVRAADYSSFWIWGGVKPQPVLSRAQDLYILQGQVSEIKVENRSRVVVRPQGMPVARLRKGRVWLVFRANTLNWTPDVVGSLVLRLRRWQLSGNPIVGLQVDFDTRTRHLNEYVAFLRQLRAELPAEYRLSITGLLDWSSNGDIEAVNGLSKIVDEVTIQTYQGRKTIPDYAVYLSRLRRLAMPFKVGLIQNGEWQPPDGLESNPWFRGYIIFLQNQDV